MKYLSLSIILILKEFGNGGNIKIDKVKMHKKSHKVEINKFKTQKNGKVRDFAKSKR